MGKTTDRFNELKLHLSKNLVMLVKIYTAYKVNHRDVFMLILGFKLYNKLIETNAPVECSKECFNKDAKKK